MEEIRKKGWAVVDDVIAKSRCFDLRDLGQGTHVRNGRVFGRRNALDDERVIEIARDRDFRALAEEAIGGSVLAVRAIWFDKPAGANWSVPWHQDLTLALAEKHEAEGFGPWTVKEGRWHAQAPAALLEKMVSLRLHLDPCGPEDGPLRVRSGSHRFGRVPLSQGAEESVLGDVGSVALMRPLLYHASSPRIGEGHRRVLHIDYAAVDALPEPLRWCGSV